MAKQSIRFNYFEPKLVGESGEEYLWDMKPFIEYIIGNRNAFNAPVVLGDEIADLEWNSCYYDENAQLFYIQLSKLRSKNIPSRKKVSQDKVSIHLDEDEFLGEFNLLIYDPNINILIIQSNFYGLTIKQVANALSNMRLNYKEAIEESENDNPFIVSLRPIIDTQAIDKVKTNEIYRKIKIKGSNYREIANERLNSTVLDTAINSIDEINGVNFEISLSMARAPKNETLEKEEVINMIDDVLDLKERNLDVSMNITTKKDEEDAIEYIDLLEPRLTSKIVLEVKNRSTIGAEYIFQAFKEQNYFDEAKHLQHTARSLVHR